MEYEGENYPVSAAALFAEDMSMSEDQLKDIYPLARDLEKQYLRVLVYMYYGKYRTLVLAAAGDATMGTGDKFVIQR